MLISDRVAAVGDIADEFEQAVASLGWTGGAVELLDQLATGGALAYLRNADGGGAIGLLHAVTSPLACELLLPWLAQEDRAAALGYVVAGRGGAPRRLRRRPAGAGPDDGAPLGGIPGGPGRGLR